MIRLIDATKHYGDSVTVYALRAVNLHIAPAEFVAIMGPSGCGKSTLLHVLGGLDRLTSGQAFLAEKPLHQLDENGLTQLRRSHIGFVFQFFNLLPTLTVAENVTLPSLLQNVPAKQSSQKCQELLELVGLQHRTHHRLHQISGGEMQRAALARALINDPKVLLADEPTGNLDSETSGKVIRLFKDLGKRLQTTIVMVTHSREVAASADRIIEMRDGQIVSA